MKAKKILVPIDYSPCSTAALGLAATIARDTGATLLLLHVDETPIFLAGGEYLGASLDAIQTEALKRLNEVVLPDPSLPCERFLQSGFASQEIVQIAKEQQVDFIVMGTHGRRGLGRLLMGSTAEAVLRRAPCPVITLKHAVTTEQPAAEQPAAVV